MNEVNQGQPQSFELPKPVDSEPAAAQPERQTEPVVGQPAQMPAADPAQLAQPVPMPHVQDDKVTQSSTDDDNLSAEDNELIEKEWVQKAKQIIERTAEDPHKQKDEITAFSASYLKKRYGKDIKVE